MKQSQLHLAPLESTVVRLLQRGLTNAEIGTRLGMTKGSTLAVMARLRLKFGANSREEMMRYARQGKARPRFTKRDIDVLKLMSRGYGNGEIAQRLGVSRRSADSYVTSVRTRLGGGSRYDVVSRAHQMGLIPQRGRAGVREIELTLFRRRVLELAARKLTNTEIGAQLGRSRAAVADALRYTRKKLRVNTTSDAIVEARKRGLITSRERDAIRNPLTARELDILDGLFAGWMHREISEALGISIGNIAGRIQRMKAKFRATTTEELLDEVERLGLYRRRLVRKRFVARQVISKKKPPSYGAKSLTPRQLDVIEELARSQYRGLDRLARSLGIAKSTLQKHLTMIHYRIGVQETSLIVDQAAKLGLIRRRSARK